MKKETFSLEVITPEKVLLSQEAASIVLPAGNGSLGILPGHAPLISKVGIGILKVRDTAKKEKLVFVNDGFIMVSLEGVTILARSAEAKEMIDARRATAAKERAEQRLAHRDQNTDVQRARDALVRAECRLKIVLGGLTK
jgi:F-type H+-transporting ATPase subunit epsilon